MLKDVIKEIKGYTRGISAQDAVKEFGVDKDKIIKLNSNENPLGPSPKAVDCIIRNATCISEYPNARNLRESIAEYVGFPSKNIILGNGSDDIVDTITRMFIDKGDEVIIPIPTFPLYEIITKLNGGIPRFIRRDEDFNIPIDNLLSSINKNTKIIFLCSPNNPTGNITTEESIRMLLDLDIVLILDEAYVEFAGSSLVHLAREYENLVVVRTFSKAFGLAGLRVGYAIVPVWLASAYMRVSMPFSLNQLGIFAAIGALQDKTHLDKTIKLVKEGREFLLNHIKFKTYPSEANFVLVDVSPWRSRDITQRLMAKGILVRDCSPIRGSGNHFIRVSVGKVDENREFVESLERF